MALGKCVNISKPCSKAINREEIEAEKSNFVCPECGKPLVEIKDKKKVKGPNTINWKLIAGIIAAVVVLAGAGFGIWKFVLDAPKIDKIKLDKQEVTLVIGESPKDVLKATVVDKKGNEIKNAKVTFTWLTGDESVVTVTQGGEISAVSKGETTVTVKIEGNEELRGTCQVEVKYGDVPIPVYIEHLTLKDAKDFTLNVGGTKQLGFVATPERHDENPSWTSSDPTVAVVDADGLVSANKAGTATISIVAKNVAASVTVTVKGNNPPPPSTGNCQINLGYGVYDGPCKGGKANGTGGTIRFTSHHTIDLKKASGETVDVEAGDTMVNVKMEDNRLIQGQLKRKDGSTRWIIIG